VLLGLEVGRGRLLEDHRLLRDGLAFLLDGLLVDGVLGHRLLLDGAGRRLLLEDLARRGVVDAL